MPDISSFLNQLSIFNTLNNLFIYPNITKCIACHKKYGKKTYIHIHPDVKSLITAKVENGEYQQSYVGTFTNNTSVYDTLRLHDDGGFCAEKFLKKIGLLDRVTLIGTGAKLYFAPIRDTAK